MDDKTPDTYTVEQFHKNVSDSIRERYLERLNTVLALQDGWYNGEGKAPTKEAGERAKQIIENMVLAACPFGKIFPTVEGGVLIECFELEDFSCWIASDGAIETLIINNEVVDENGNIVADDA